MRGLVFSRRVAKELTRDPLSYIFCIAAPIAMMLLFFVIYQNVPAGAQANMAIFRPDIISTGIAFFGYSFVMLFGTLLLSKDRATAYLTRLYASPMTPFDFLLGYFLPLFSVGVIQTVLTFAVGGILGAIADTPLSIVGCLRATVALLPSLLFFIACGLHFGALLSEKAAPGVTSVIITLSGIMGGVWMPLDTMPKLKQVFSVFPFSHAVSLARGAMQGVADEIGLHLAVTLGYTVVVAALAVYAMYRSTRRESR